MHRISNFEDVNRISNFEGMHRISNFEDMHRIPNFLEDDAEYPSLKATEYPAEKQNAQHAWTWPLEI
jgi:hypothetical protein